MLVERLKIAAEPGWTYTEHGVTNTTVADAAANIASYLAAMTPASTVTDVLLNWGVNDVPHDGEAIPAFPVEATWKADYLAIIDAVHAWAPSAIVRVTKPWAQICDTNVQTLYPWIDDIVAARAYARVADNELDWFKPNVATYSTDGTHWNAAGWDAKAAASQTGMGF